MKGGAEMNARAPTLLRLRVTHGPSTQRVPSGGGGGHGGEGRGGWGTRERERERE